MWSGPSSCAAGRADLIAAFEIVRRLNFLDAVNAGRQIGEAYLPLASVVVEAMRLPEPSSR